MTTQPRALTGAVELLDRALAYTRVVLAGVSDEVLDRPTPCTDWDLGALLTHMEDALDVFTEAADGSISRAAPLPGAHPRVARLQEKACALLGSWSGHPASGVHVAGHDVEADLLVATAALEITVHGWDVGEALGGAPRLPDAFAAALLDVARVVVRPEDRAVRFAPPRSVDADASPGQQLLAHLGRS